MPTRTRSVVAVLGALALAVASCSSSTGGQQSTAQSPSATTTSALPDTPVAVTPVIASVIAAPVVLWDMLNEATVTVECVASDAAAAAETVQAVIRHTAEADAQIGVREIKIVKVSPAGE